MTHQMTLYLFGPPVQDPVGIKDVIEVVLARLIEQELKHFRVLYTSEPAWYCTQWVSDVISTRCSQRIGMQSMSMRNPLRPC